LGRDSRRTHRRVVVCVLQSHRKFRLVAEEVKGTDILTNFHGMDITR
jgi:ribosomal protein S3AE